MFVTTDFWLDVLKIIMIDLMLSGDNAVVIALACRNLPAAQRKQGVLYGMTGAVVLRIVLTFFAVNLLSLPYLKLAGAMLLIWVGIKLIQPEVEPDEGAVKADVRLIGAVKTIIIADFVMSLDNVLGVAAAANGNVPLLVFGLLISIPLIAWSSQLVLKLIDRLPFIIYLGGALLGYVAGEMLLAESSTWSNLSAAWQARLHWLIPSACALLVLALGQWLAQNKAARGKTVDLLDGKSIMPDND